MGQTGIDRRPRRRGALHEKEFSVDSVGIALHHHGAILQMRQQPRRNVQVILQQVALRKPQPGEIHFLQIGELHRAAINGQRNGSNVCRYLQAD